MGVRQQSKQDVAKKMHQRYLKASRAEKGKLLDELVELTGYHRTYAHILLKHGPPVHPRSIRRAGRPRVYGSGVVGALKVCAEALEWPCGKRLQAALPDLVAALELEGELRLSVEDREALLQMGSATIDRRLSEARRLARPRGIPTTKPGSLLKSQIPIRTYTPWDEQVPGFVELDLVAHCGESTAGEHLFTLDATDIATGWTECEPVLNKGQAAVFAALKQIRQRLPFPLLGIDSDNGSEFINAHLYRYCAAERLTFTRCRAYHKNDQAHVEQKNYTHVRRLVGYDRLEGEEAYRQLGRIYALARVWHNGYLPTMKLIAKQREGAKVSKRYDEPRTPYRRAVSAGVVGEEAKLEFEQLLGVHAPMRLKRQLDTQIERLGRLGAGVRALAATVR